MPDNNFKWTNSLLTALKRKRITTVAGAWVYYFLLAFVPLVFLILMAFNLFGIDISQEIVTRLPEEFRLAGQTISDASEKLSGGITVFFIGTVMFSVTSLLNQMSKDGDYIYGCKSVKKRGIFRRLWAVLALALFFLIFLAVAIVVSFWNMFFSNLGAKTGTLTTILSFTAIILVSYVIIIFLNKFICPNKLKIKDSLLGGLVSLSIIVLGTIGFILYIKYFANYNAFYGSLSAVIVFLLWAYILMLGLCVGAVVNMVGLKSARAGRKCLDKANQI